MPRVIDTLEYHPNNWIQGQAGFIHISGNVYAVANYAEAFQGILYTFDIDAAGSIGAVIDSYVFESLPFPAYCGEPQMVHISGTIYAIVFTSSRDLGGGVNFCGRIITVNIANNGIITHAIIDSFNFGHPDGPGEKRASDCQIIHVTGNYYAITYYDGASDGWLSVIDIDVAGNIGAAFTSEWEFEPVFSLGDYKRILHISGDVYAIAYRRANWKGTLLTVSINNLGIIGGQIDNYEFDSGTTGFLTFVHVSGTVYAIGYVDTTAIIGKVVTISIANDGTITHSLIDSLNFETGANDSVGLLAAVMVNDSWVCSYSIIPTAVGDWRGMTAEVRIASDGTMKFFNITYQWGTTYTLTDPVAILHISGGIFAIIHRGEGEDGYVTTVFVLAEVPTVQTLAATGVT